MIEMIIFDCDGTLVDSEALNNYAASSVLINAGYKDYTQPVVEEKFIGFRISEAFAVVEAETGIKAPDDMVQRFLDAVKDNAEEYIKPFSEITQTVSALSESMKICVASNGERSNVIESLELSGLKPFFPDDHVFTAVMVPRGKPDPALFQLAANKMGVAAENCLVIEDSRAGITAAQAANMKVLGFTGFSHDKEAAALMMQELKADAVISSFEDIQAYLGAAQRAR